MTLRYHRLTGYKYIVAAEFAVSIPELAGVQLHAPLFALMGGILTVRPGYAWDGASGPTIDTPATIAASLVHDVLYQCIRSGLLPATFRATADMVLYRLMRAASTGNRAWIEIRSLYYFAAVRLFGGSAAKPRSEEPQDHVYTAP